MRRPCGTSATPRAAIISGGKPLTFWPNTVTTPRRGANRPIVTFIHVDLPAPLRPNRPSLPPSPSSHDPPPRTWLSPQKRSKWLRLSAVMAKIDLPCAGICDHLRAITLDDHLAKMQERNALGEFQCHVHVVFDHHDGDVARNRQQQLLHVTPFVDRQACKWLVK